MKIDKIADKIKRESIIADESYIKALLNEEQNAEKSIEYLLVLFWAEKKNKKKLQKEVTRIANELFEDMEEDLMLELEKKHREGYAEGAFLAQLLLGSFAQMPGVPTYNYKWHYGNMSFLDDLLYYKNRLLDSFNKELERMIALKAPVTEALSAIRRPFKTLSNSTKAMVDMELAQAERQGMKEAYIGYDAKGYRYLATLDGLTCDTCADLDGRVFPISEAQVGVNYPPMHRWCRCVTIPVFDDFDKNKRVAKDENGDNIDVTMTYDEWKKKYANKTKVSTADMENAQEYRPITRSKSAIGEERGSKEFIVRKIENSTYSGEVFISDSVNLKPKQMHTIETSLNGAFRIVGGENAPKCMIISPEEMKTGSVCSYHAMKNTVYINSVVADTEKLLELQQDMACPNNPLSTYVHEFIHWKDAQEYLKTANIVSQSEYLSDLRSLCKIKLARLEKQGYNIHNISKYSTKKYLLGEYDEVLTEFRVDQLLGKGK